MARAVYHRPANWYTAISRSGICACRERWRSVSPLALGQFVHLIEEFCDVERLGNVGFRAQLLGLLLGRRVRCDDEDGEGATQAPALQLLQEFVAVHARH